MKKITLSVMAVAMLQIAANAQKSNLKYTDEGFDTKKVESTYALQTAGQQFAARMNTLYQQTSANAYARITRDQYASFLTSFQNLVGLKSGNSTVSRNLSVLASIMNSVNDFAYNNDEYRNSIYRIAAPVNKAVTEDWGDEVVNVAIYNAYFDMREFVAKKSVDDAAMAMTLQLIDDNSINTQTKETCTYKVTVDPKLAKDSIEIYFTDPALYTMASKKYPEAQLLAGPIRGWENNIDESAGVYSILKTYAAQTKHTGYTIYNYDIAADGKNNTLNQPLYKDNKWFMWVFRNGKLYYSYMTEPCSMISRAQIK
ncbi:MAG: hypothetical protein EOP51_01985 [Sphingobacteriales bacterium]|nr:MAG: hypothetical protein EOP51_01985 [Sphingobacteriales bacterium]